MNGNTYFQRARGVLWEHLGYLERLAVSLTCKDCRNYKPDDLQLIKDQFDRWNLDFLDLRDKSCYLSGGFLVQAVYGLKWDSSDIDLYTEFDGGVLYRPYENEGFDISAQAEEGLKSDSQGRVYFTTRPFGCTINLVYSLISRDLYNHRQIDYAQNPIWSLHREEFQKKVRVNGVENLTICQGTYQPIIYTLHQIKDFTLCTRAGQAIKVQDIIMKDGWSIERLIDRFDINLCQMYFDGTRIRFKDLDAVIHRKLKVQILNPKMEYVGKTMDRVIKYCNRLKIPFPEKLNSAYFEELWEDTRSLYFQNLKHRRLIGVAE